MKLFNFKCAWSTSITAAAILLSPERRAPPPCNRSLHLFHRGGRWGRATCGGHGRLRTTISQRFPRERHRLARSRSILATASRSGHGLETMPRPHGSCRDRATMASMAITLTAQPSRSLPGSTRPRCLSAVRARVTMRRRMSASMGSAPESPSLVTSPHLIRSSRSRADSRSA